MIQPRLSLDVLGWAGRLSDEYKSSGLPDRYGFYIHKFFYPMS